MKNIYRLVFVVSILLSGDFVLGAEPGPAETAQTSATEKEKVSKKVFAIPRQTMRRMILDSSYHELIAVLDDPPFLTEEEAQKDTNPATKFMKGLVGRGDWKLVKQFVETLYEFATQEGGELTNVFKPVPAHQDQVYVEENRARKSESVENEGKGLFPVALLQDTAFFPDLVSVKDDAEGVVQGFPDESVLKKLLTEGGAFEFSILDSGFLRVMRVHATLKLSEAHLRFGKTTPIKERRDRILAFVDHGEQSDKEGVLKLSDIREFDAIAWKLSNFFKALNTLVDLESY